MTKSEVVAHFGGVSKVAKALGLTYEAVRQWPLSVPKLRQYQIEQMTGGALQVEDSLRPKNQVA